MLCRYSVEYKLIYICIKHKLYIIIFYVLGISNKYIIYNVLILISMQSGRNSCQISMTERLN